MWRVKLVSRLTLQDRGRASMQINTNPVRIPLISGAKTVTPKTVPSTGSDKSFAASAALDEGLRDTPDVRHSEIERATRLVQTGNYPPPEVVRRLSRLLADEISNTDTGS